MSFPIPPRLAVLGSLLLLLPALGAAQPAVGERPLSLQEAVAEALENNAALKVTEAQQEIASAQVTKATAPLYPQLAVESGFARTTDPVGAFGIKLRQARIGQADFAPPVLNEPAPINNWTSTAGVRWGVVSPTAWAGRAAAQRQAEAARWGTVRMREATALQTRVQYYEAVRARAQRGAAERSEAAARATYEIFRRRGEQGVLTEADVLQAEAELLAATTRRVDAERQEQDARRQLALFLGWSGDQLPLPTDTLAQPAELTAQDFSPQARADLRALESARAAAAAGRRAARASFLPTLNAFAGYNIHGQDAFANDGDDWSLGLMVQLPVFAGFARRAEVQQARLQERVVATEYEQRLREARAEVAQAQGAVRASEQGVQATQGAVRAAEAGAAMMRRRFEQGLATPADLLQAEARATAMRGAAIDALASYQMAVANLQFTQSTILSNEDR